MAEPEYRRLTRGRNRYLFAVALAARSSLWLGKDHLLQIDTNGYTETYKRFYFRDIQALVLCKTNAGLRQTVVLGAITGVLTLIAILGTGEIVAWVFGSLAALFGIGLLLELVAGPTSKCYLRTAVQTEHLVSLPRVRGAQKVLASLHPLITQVQGERIRSPDAVAGGAIASSTENLEPPVQAATDVSNPPGAPSA
jgi:hypothetical protein